MQNTRVYAIISLTGGTKMNAYTNFSNFYDELMDNINYKEWGNYLLNLLKEYGICSGIVLELGCGTGNICEYLAKKGYDVIGIDNSLEMLGVANEKKMESGMDILYLNQDMRNFELYGTVKAVVSNCDSINYILEKKDLIKVFKLVNNYLDPGGVFIFDLNTEHKYKEIGDSVIAENREAISFIWENSYIPNKKLNRYDLTLFIKEEDGRFEKTEETHFQRAYSLEEIKEVINKAGMEFVSAYNGFTKNQPEIYSDRIHIIAREKGKINV